MSSTIRYPEDHPHSPVSRAQRSVEKENDAQNRKLAGVATTAVLLGAGVLIAANMQNGNEKAPKRQSVEAFASIDRAQNGVLILKSGARYRLSPEFEDGGDRDQLDNRAGKVEKGKEIFIHRPISSANSSWVAFTIPPKEGHKPAPIRTRQDRIEQTRWINVDQLKADKLLVVAQEQTGGSASTSLQVTETGALSTPKGIDPTIAVSRELPANTAENLMATGVSLNFK